MFEKKTQELRRAMMWLDMFLTALAMLIACWIGMLVEKQSVAMLSHFALLPLMMSLEIPFLEAFKGYGTPRTNTLLTYSWSVFKAVSASLAILLTLIFLLNIDYLNRPVLVIFGVLTGILLVFLRGVIIYYFRRAISRGEATYKVLLIGTGTRARRMAKTLLERSEWGIEIIGYLDPEPGRVPPSDSPLLGTVNDTSRVLKDHVVDEVIVSVPRTMFCDVDAIVKACEQEGVKLRLMADVWDIHAARTSLVDLNGIPLLTLEPVALEDWKVMVKRVVDLAFSIMLLPVLLPLIGILSILIKLDSPGPVFFIQQRVGLNKRRFPMIKFRSMVQNSESMMAQLEALNEARGPIFKIANDPRITRVGKILRRTSLDEIPQIFNVLRGEMSLVGPRPMSTRDVDLFDEGIQRKRFSVKPGVTCLWQVSGRSQLPFSKWLELDLYYISHWSLGLDFKILAKTIPAVLKGSGAC